MDRGGLSELGNSVRSIDIKLLTEIGPVVSTSLTYMSFMQMYQVDSSQLRTVDWTIDGKGKSLVKLEHWVLDQNLAMSVSALCHVLCALQPMKNSLVRPE